MNSVYFLNSNWSESPFNCFLDNGNIWIWNTNVQITCAYINCLKCAIHNIKLSWKLSIPYVHHSDVIMIAMASQITSLTIAYSTVYSDEDQRKYQSSASLAFVRGIHWWPVNSPHKGPATLKIFSFADIIVYCKISCLPSYAANVATNKIQEKNMIVPLKNKTTFREVVEYSISQEICTRFLLCFALLWLYIDWFSHIHQAYFTGTVTI